MIIRSVFCCLITIAVILSVTPMSSQAKNLEELLNSAVSLGAKVTGDVHLSKIERGFEKIDQGVDATRVADPTTLRQALRVSDPKLLQQFDNLDKSDAEKLIRLHDGATQLLKASPDALSRARAIQQGGPELLIASERYGEDMTRPAFRILAAEDIGQLPSGSLQKFSKRVVVRGDQILNVWNTKILPNWKEFAAAGLLADILLNDGDWITATGEFIARKGAEAILDTATAVPKAISEVVQEKLQGPDKIFVFGIIAVLVLLTAVWIYRGISRFFSIFVKSWKLAIKGFGVVFRQINTDSPSIKKRSRMKASSSHMNRHKQ